MSDFNELFGEIQRLKVGYLVVWSLEDERWGEEEGKVKLFFKDPKCLHNLLHLFLMLSENSDLQIDLVNFLSVQV